MKVGRNDPCPCGSGKKYKHCCYAKDSVKHDAPPEEAEAEVDAETDPEAAEEEHLEDERRSQRAASQQKGGRGRFQGDARGRGTTFRPPKRRGGQRGT